MLNIERKKYTAKLLEARKSARIVFISGLKGVGKTTILDAASRALKNERPPVRILHTGPDDGVTTGRELVQTAHALGIGPSALFIDDADRIESLREALAAIIANYTVTVFVAGQKTQLARELEAFAARQENAPAILATIDIMPLSYREFLEAWNMTESREALTLYCRTGGLPQGFLIAPEAPEAQEFTRLRANSFILTEIIEPAAIRNPAQFRALLALAARSTGERLPAREVSTAFAADRMTISPQAALDYLALCGESGILISVPTLDIAKDQKLDSSDIWYFGDTGLRSAFSGKETPASIARAEENLAYLKFLDDGWRVARGRVGSGKYAREDITFVCGRGEPLQRVYVQIISSSASAAERLRKREALLAVRDAWPKYLVDANEDATPSKDGIKRLSMRELLLDDSIFTDLNRTSPGKS
jgi:predicted AAA+ superfamily ATPase